MFKALHKDKERRQLHSHRGSQSSKFNNWLSHSNKDPEKLKTETERKETYGSNCRSTQENASWMREETEVKGKKATNSLMHSRNIEFTC
jgi:hypothetical protein